MKKILLLILVSILSIGSVISQCDGILFVQFNSDGNDAFAFVALEDYPAGTEIQFTDNGWLTSGEFRSGEGTITYTVPVGGLSAGDAVEVVPSGGSFNTSSSGDQIIAYTGMSSSPTIIGAINFDGSDWASNATSSNTSADPSAPNSQAIPEVDNAAYIGSTSGSCTELIAVVLDDSNWNTSNTVTQSYSGGNFTLPVQLSSFLLADQLDEIEIFWSTNLEIDNDYFTIQHSEDGHIFDDVGKVSGSGTTSEEQEYSFIHRNPSPGINYYRLKQTDFNGQYEIFPAKSIIFERESNVSNIYPTITTDYVNIVLNKEEKFQYYINSIDGRMLKQGQEIGNQVTIDFSDFPAGQYILIVNSANESKSKRIIKK